MTDRKDRSLCVSFTDWAHWGRISAIVESEIMSGCFP